MAKGKEEIKENIIIEDLHEDDISLQRFMDDMQMLGDQVRNRKLKKPAFHYGSLEITNYLLWLILSELMISNTKGEVK